MEGLVKSIGVIGASEIGDKVGCGGSGGQGRAGGGEGLVQWGSQVQPCFQTPG